MEGQWPPLLSTTHARGRPESPAAPCRAVFPILFSPVLPAALPWRGLSEGAASGWPLGGEGRGAAPKARRVPGRGRGGARARRVLAAGSLAEARDGSSGRSLRVTGRE